MTTTAEALEVLTIVAACHRRTAPRMDDREASLATASVWAELFSQFDLSAAELITAVKTRAVSCVDAPEPADIIRVARAARNDHSMRRDSDPPAAIEKRGMTMAEWEKLHDCKFPVFRTPKTVR